MSSHGSTIQAAWPKVVDVVKDRVNSRSVWEAMERSHAIALEDDGTLVVGLDASHAGLSSHLTGADHRRIVEKAVESILSRKVKLRIIEGTTLQDWEATKQREHIVAAQREASFERREKKQADTSSWDMVYEQAARSFAALAFRQFPQSRAQYLSDMLYVLSDAIDRLAPRVLDEANERMLARVIERVAGNAEVPATVVALELDRLQAWQKQQSS